jgi:hypothetical protein
MQLHPRQRGALEGRRCRKRRHDPETGTRIPLSYMPTTLLIFQKLFETPGTFVTRR